MPRLVVGTQMRMSELSGARSQATVTIMVICYRVRLSFANNIQESPLDDKTDHPIDDFVKLQLEYARKLRLHQDLLRFAIPAAYFTFAGAALKIVLDSKVELTAFAWVALTFLGAMIYIATISEHYFYAAFRNWERHLERLAINPKYRASPTTSGTSVAPGQVPDDEISSESVDIRTWRDAVRVKDISQPNLAHPTMLAILLGIALSVGAYVDKFAVAALPYPNLLGPTLGILAVVGLLFIYRDWHRFYKTVVSRLLAILKTRNLST
jgi:hypothetical protein